MEVSIHSRNPQPTEPGERRTLSLEDAARVLNVSRRTIYNRIREGRLRTVRTIGGSQRVIVDERVLHDVEVAGGAFEGRFADDKRR